MEIRAATAADIPALIAIERQAKTAAHWTDADYARLFEPAAPCRIALVAEDAGPQGFLVALAVGVEWEIENVVVAAAARGRGLGSALVRHLLATAARQAVQAIWLEVRESNTAARALYAKCGFGESGRRRGYYAHPVEDAIVCQYVIGGR